MHTSTLNKTVYCCVLILPLCTLHIEFFYWCGSTDKKKKKTVINDHLRANT